MGEIAALLSALCWAGTSIAMARLASRYPAAILTGIQFATAAPILIALLVFTGHGREVIAAGMPTALAMVASGFIGYGLGDTTYIHALPRLGVQRVAPTASALWVTGGALGGVLLLGERGGAGLVIGGAAVVTGTYLLLDRASPRLDAPDGAIGASDRRGGSVGTAFLALAVAPAAWTVSTLLIAGARGDLGALAAGTLRVSAGAVALLAANAASYRGGRTAALPRGRELAVTVALGVVGSAGGSLLYTFGVTYAGAARAVILGSTSPLLTLPLAMIFLGERPTRRIGAGTVLCVAGALLVVAGV